MTTARERDGGRGWRDENNEVPVYPEDRKQDGGRGVRGVVVSRANKGWLFGWGGGETCEGTETGRESGTLCNASKTAASHHYHGQSVWFWSVSVRMGTAYSCCQGSRQWRLHLQCGLTGPHRRRHWRRQWDEEGGDGGQLQANRGG